MNAQRHAVITWGIEVQDDFTGATITPVAMVLDGKETNEYYNLQPMTLALPTVRQLHEDLGRLVKYMEKGVPGSRSSS